MLRWSSSFPIPFDGDQYDPLWAAQLDNNLYIASAGYYTPKEQRMDLIMFDTEKEKFSTVTCKCDSQVPSEIISMTNIGNVLYIWGNAVDDHQNYDRTLYKMDITSGLEWTKVITLSFEGRISNVAIVENLMYLTVEFDFLTLFTIDLTSRIFTRNTLKDEVSEFVFLTVINDKKLCLIEHDGGYRTVSMIENRKLIQVASEEYPHYKSQHFPHNFSDLGCNVLYFSEFDGAPVTFFEIFDFESKTWTRSAFVELLSWYKTAHNCLKIDNKVYKIMESHEPYKFEVRVLELLPKLSTICLLNLVDRGDFTESKSQLPFNLRNTFDRMIDWRLAELQK